MESKLINIFGKILGCGFVSNPLEDVLSNYIETDVRVDPELMEKHTKHVQRVIKSLKNAFESPIAKQLLGDGIKFKGVLESGSAFENLKVLVPDEFDVMLKFEPVKILKNQWKAGVLDKESLNTGYVNFDVQRKFDGETDDQMKKFMKLELNNGLFLETIDPVKFYDIIGDFMVEVLDKSTFEYHRNPLELLDLQEPQYTSTTRRRGPAVTITVKDSITGQTMSLDLVPTLELADGKLLVPKEKHWRQSYALPEKDLLTQIERNNKDMVDVLRIVKAKSSKERKISPLSMVDSYTYKNALFWFYHQKPNAYGLGTVLKEYFAFLEERFQTGKLPRYFEERCNLLDRVDDDKLKFLATYLRNIRENNYFAEFIDLNQVQTYYPDLNLTLISNEIKNNDNIKNNNLQAVVENLKNHFENRGVGERVRYEYLRVEVVSRDEICLVFQLDAGLYLPTPSKVDDNPNFKPYNITETRTNEVLNYLKFNQIIDKEIQAVHTTENGVKISWGFVFTGHSELDPELIYQPVGLANTESFRVLIRSKLNRMRKSMDKIDGGIRARVLNELQRVVSKQGLNLDELLVSAVINKADEYLFSHSGQELIMLNYVVGYIAQCLEDGSMPSPVDRATNVLVDFNNLKDRLKEIFPLKVDRFHRLMFDP